VNRSPKAARDAEASPNQNDKRRQIIAAARTVLARDGLAACTARNLAAESPLTKSAIHYYFDDMEEIVDQAMDGHIEAFVEQLWAAADRHDQPADRFWAVMENYLATFRSAPTTALLWFGYWVDVGHKGRLGPIESMHRKVQAVLVDLLFGLDVPNPQRTSHALHSYLIGTVIQQLVSPKPFAEIRSEIAVLCGLEDVTAQRRRSRRTVRQVG